MAPERMFEKISNFKIMNILYIILKHVVWRWTETDISTWLLSYIRQSKKYINFTPI